MIDHVAARRLPLRPLYIATILAGSFLLFLVQPMFGRLVLPVLGGAPAVWNTAMLFYQTALLAGYLYADRLSRLPLGRQLAIHLGVFAAAALTLPLGMARWYPAATGDGAPTLWLIGLLAVSVGPVFFAVSAQAPLLQSWFARSDDADADNPYFLYAASNLGSFAALIAYPLLVEPALPLGSQLAGWSAGFVGLALLTALGGLAVARGAGTTVPAPRLARPASWAQRGRWTLLAAIASGLLLSTTTHLTTDIMAMPLLWVIPLGLYLLSFVIVFSSVGPAATRLAVALAPLVLLVAGATACLSSGPQTGMILAGAGLVLLFVIAVALHGTLAAERPPADQLTDFYVWMSVGGALGGVFCALVAPALFDWPYENAMLVLAAALLLPTRPPGPLFARLWQAPALRVAAATGALALSVLAAWRFGTDPITAGGALAPVTITVLLGLVPLAVTAIGRRGLFAALLAALMLTLGGWQQLERSVEGRHLRSFFGSYTVTDQPAPGWRLLFHGTTMHGQQSLLPGNARVPMTYYAPGSGVGLVMQAAPALFGPAPRIGFVGLGTGTLACYHRPGQRWTAYEIDPLIERIARTRFSYLAGCNRDLAIVLGDARLRLAAAPAAGLDLLAVDAFSSDAIPLHLVTREAFRVYGRALAPDGVLLVHITNRFLDLEPVIAAIAAAEGWQGAVRNWVPPASQPKGQLFTASDWIVLSRAPQRLAAVTALRGAGETAGWRPLRRDPALAAWRDDFASVLPALKALRPEPPATNNRP